MAMMKMMTTTKKASASVMIDTRTGLNSPSFSLRRQTNCDHYWNNQCDKLDAPCKNNKARNLTDCEDFEYDPCLNCDEDCEECTQ